MTIPSVRDPELLHPLLCPLWQRHMMLLRREGMLPLFVFGYRSGLHQERLWQIGRRGVEGEKIVTRARAGQSWHNVERDGRGASLAYDLALLDARGKAYLPDSDEAWIRAGEIGEALGLTWGGRWPMRDLGHYQLDGGGRLTLADATSGADPIL